VRTADNLTTFMCRLSWNLGASISWNPHGLSRPVMGLLYPYVLRIVILTWRHLGYESRNMQRFIVNKGNLFTSKQVVPIESAKFYQGFKQDLVNTASNLTEPTFSVSTTNFSSVIHPLYTKFQGIKYFGIQRRFLPTHCKCRGLLSHLITLNWHINTR
jgi:hypothetical protein